MMKKLLVLTAVVMLTAGTVGCQSCGWFRRGSLFPWRAPGVTYLDPGTPCEPVEPCAPVDASGSIPPILPGPEIGS